MLNTGAPRLEWSADQRRLVPVELREMAEEINQLLWSFQWAYPGGGENRGEIHVDLDHGSPNLVLLVWTPDNDADEIGEIKELTVTRPISPSGHPAEQIRDIIHWYLCHESDEQMFFCGARVFDPHLNDRSISGDFLRPEWHRILVKNIREQIGLD